MGRPDRASAQTLPQFPLECLCTCEREDVQLALAARVRELLPHRPDVSYEIRRDGLLIGAETELALARPLSILTEVYAQGLHIGPPRIRYHLAEDTEEPHMGVRVLCAAKHFDIVRNDLSAREATIVDEELRPPIGVIRATAPLRRLLGYSRWLFEQTHGSAREVLWFSHYARLPQSARESVPA